MSDIDIFNRWIEAGIELVPEPYLIDPDDEIAAYPGIDGFVPRMDDERVRRFFRH
jgi:hypothetical protein